MNKEKQPRVVPGSAVFLKYWEQTDVFILLHLCHNIQMRFELKASLLNSELDVNPVDASECLR